MNCTNNMSFAHPEWGFGQENTSFPQMKMKYRWFFGISNITGDSDQALPCIRASRPKIQFREMQAEHLNETIYYPSKPEWQPIQIILYDRCINQEHPVFTWLRLQYDPKPSSSSGSGECHASSYFFNCDTCGDSCSQWFPCIDPLSFKTCACLQLYDGCGEVIERWILEHCYPQSVDFGELDMGANEIITADVVLRYDRAFQVFPAVSHKLFDNTACVTCSPNSCAADASKSGSTLGFTQELSIAPSIKNPDFMMI